MNKTKLKIVAETIIRVTLGICAGLVIGCAQGSMNNPVKISENVLWVGGENSGHMVYDTGKREEFRNPGFFEKLKKDYNPIDIYADQKFRRILFNNKYGGEVVLMKVFHNDSLIQICDEPEIGAIASGGGSFMVGSPGVSGGMMVSGGSAGPPPNKNDIECFLKNKFDTLDVRLYDGIGLVSKYLVYAKGVEYDSQIKKMKPKK